MAISTRLIQQQPYDEPWLDPNAYNTGGDPNAPIAGSTGGTATQPYNPATATPDDPTVVTKPPSTSTPGATGGSGTGGLPTVPDGSGGTIPVPPPVYDPQLPWEAPAPTTTSSGGSGGAPPAGGGYNGSYPIDPNITGSGRGWDELNKMFDNPMQQAGPSARTLKFQGMSDEAIDKILHGPDRLQIAKDYYDIFDKETEGDYQRDLKNATNLGAARGRLGSGLLTNTYGDLFERRASDKDTTKRRLLTDALQGTIGDRQAAYDAISRAEQNAFGEDAALRGENRQEREARLAMINDWFNQQQGAYNREFGERKYGDDLAFRGREEERGDRQYTDSRADQDLLNRLRLRDQELEEQKARWQHDYDLWQMGNGPYPGPKPT